MREILFRGKLKADNLPNKKGDWVFGHFVILKDGDRDIPCIYGFGEVYPATVGQFTVLTDKNGKKIFEGDIIKTKKYGKDVGRSNVNDYDIFEVKYVPARFVLENHNRRFLLEDDGYSKFEVIGNVHDNPELIGGAE